MNDVCHPVKAREMRQHMVIEAVPWRSFEKIADALSEHHLRITYDRGRLELMSPLPIHELWKEAIKLFLTALSAELRIPIKSYGSTTFRREDVEKGLEPDECFYLASAARLRDRRVIDLSIDPPPDLAIEVENTTSCLDRMSIYANLGVPEIWTFDGATLQPHRLTAGPQYEPVPASPQLPFLPLAEVVPVINQAANAADDGQVLLDMLAWVRQRVAALYLAAGGTLPPAP
jgi:Uma2 family endonuclease